MNRQTVRFEPNQPVKLALEFPEGVHVHGHYGPQVRFLLVGQRVCYLDLEAAEALRILKLEPGEEFILARRTEPGKKPWWDAEVPGRAKTKGGDATELLPASRDISVTGAARRSEPSGAIRAASPPPPTAGSQKTPPEPVSASNPATLQSVQPTNRTQTAQATQLNQPPRQSGTVSRMPPLKATYAEAFGEILRTIRTGLDDAGEQWSDHCVQAMASTMFIQAAKDGRIRFVVEERRVA